jgi:hypothetical protein
MAYKLWVKDEAKQEINQLPGHMRQRVRRVIQSLSDEPRPSGSIEMNAPTESLLEVRYQPHHSRTSYSQP